jgi:hypothetical protein
MIEVRSCASRADEKRSLAIYNGVWPLDAVTMKEVDSFRASVWEYADFLALLDAVPVGSAVVSVTPQRPKVPSALVTVLPEQGYPLPGPRSGRRRLFRSRSGGARRPSVPSVS